MLNEFFQQVYQLPIIMAAKKITKTTPETPAQEVTPVAKKATKVSKTAKKAPAKKAAGTEAPAASKPAVAKPAAVKPSLDTVARAAYLNYRRRVEQGLPGDSHGDWLEAERQFSEPS